MSVQEVEKIQELLKAKGIQFTLTVHEPVFTSEQAARVRGVELKTGVKAMLLVNGKKEFVLALVPGDKRIDMKKISGLAGKGRLSFAKPADVVEKTHCEPGSVPPFGNVWGVQVYADRGLLESGEVNFNCGLHTHSIAMQSKDLIVVLQPMMGEFAQENG